MGGKSALRLATALTAAPVAATFLSAAIYVSTSALISGEPPMGGWQSMPTWIVVVWIYLAIIALLVTLLVGLPVHAALMRFRRSGVTPYASAGLIGGAVTSFVIYLTGLIGDPLAIILCGALSGGLTGLFAWLIRRPDRDAPANPPTSPA